MNIEKFECERLGNEYKSLLEQICYYLDYKSYISKVNIDKIRDLALKLETGECEIIQFKNSICKFDVDEKIKEEVEKKEQEKDKEIERLNNIIKRLKNDLYNMYITFGEFSDEYTKKCIEELEKGSDE